MTDRDDESPKDIDAGEGYDVLAERAGEDLHRAESPWGDSYFQEYYSWPVTRAMLPDVTDARVLIAGCGRGDHVEWFLDNGATIVGVDASEEALQIARDRFGDEASFRHADLTDSLDFAAGDFDLVLSHLVLSHVEEWRPVFEEFRRVLSPQGTFVFATVHPLYLRRENDVESYYETVRVEASWLGTRIPTYYRPTSAVVSPLVSSGFRLAALEEPKPLDEYEEYAPNRYESAAKTPEVLCVRACPRRE